MRSLVSFGALLVIAIVGCEPPVPSGVYTPTNPPPHSVSPRDPDTVEVISTGVPARPYVEIGLIDVEESSSEGMAALVKAMRYMAAKRGCDAVVLVGSGRDTTVVPMAFPGPAIVTEGGQKLRGACIVYR